MSTLKKSSCNVITGVTGMSPWGLLRENRMKIIQITDHTGGGGVNSFVYDLCFEQAKLGCEVYFIGIIDAGAKTAISELDKLRLAGVHVICLGAKSKRDAFVSAIPKLRKAIIDISSGYRCICNLHLKLSVLLGVIATRGIRNVRCVETYHNSYHHYELQYALCYPFIKHYIAISKTCGAEMKRRFHTPKNKVSVIPNGIDREKTRSMVNEDIQHGHDGVRLISIGRLSYEKNFITAIVALSELCSEELRYCMVGDGPQFNEAIRASKQNRYIEFTGWISRNRAIEMMAASDAVVIPSLWEGRSILQLEALALDKPLIMSDVPGLREVFGEEALDASEVFRRTKWGYLVRTNDIASYQSAIQDFCTWDTGDLWNAQKYIREVSEQNDINVVAEKYNTEYEKLF